MVNSWFTFHRLLFSFRIYSILIYFRLPFSWHDISSHSYFLFCSIWLIAFLSHLSADELVSVLYYHPRLGILCFHFHFPSFNTHSSSSWASDLLRYRIVLFTPYVSHTLSYVPNSNLYQHSTTSLLLPALFLAELDASVEYIHTGIYFFRLSRVIVLGSRILCLFQLGLSLSVQGSMISSWKKKRDPEQHWNNMSMQFQFSIIITRLRFRIFFSLPDADFLKSRTT